jgi:DNA-3-methyladenine glycosylase
MHWMLNCVTGQEGQPAAVLIRAVLPVEGTGDIARRRPGVRPADWTSGPARLCQALDIDSRLNGCDLTDPGSPLYIEPGRPISSTVVQAGPRVGIQNVPEPWRSIPWRFRVKPSDVYPSTEIIR